ncbi:MAG: P-II family nitrogen regulator [Gaiellales bacterium]
MSERSSVNLVTIVSEAILEDRLVRDLRTAGASGWTISVARGAGPRDRRVSDLEGGNVRIEVLCSDGVADAIMRRLADEYFPHYATIAWVATVEVLRGDRYA